MKSGFSVTYWSRWNFIYNLQFRNDISDFTEHPKIAWDSRWFWLLYHSNFRSCISGKMKQTTTKNGSWSYNERSSGGIFDLEEPSMIIGKNEKLTEKSSPRIYFSVWKNRAGVLSLRKSLRLFTHFATVAAFLGMSPKCSEGYFKVLLNFESSGRGHEKSHFDEIKESQIWNEQLSGKSDWFWAEISTWKILIQRFVREYVEKSFAEYYIIYCL